MAMRRKNLLEAFKQSRPAAPPPDAPVASSPPSGSTSSSASTSGQAAPLFESARSDHGPRGRPVGALVAIGFVVVFVLGFLVGRGSDGEAQAGESTLSEVARTPPATQPRAFQERQPASGAAGAAPAAQVPAPGEARIEDSALFDARNLVTVVVASYTKANQEYAWATYEHLHDAGLPVFPPVESKHLVLVLAGAAPTWDDLEKTEASVKALTRDGKKPYADAYRVRIDTLVPRTQQSTQKKGN